MYMDETSKKNQEGTISNLFFFFNLSYLVIFYMFNCVLDNTNKKQFMF